MLKKNCCFAFSVFMRGFTDYDSAKSKFNKLHKEYKSSKSVLFFSVNFQKEPDKMDPRLDYGFYINPDPSTR